MWPTLAKVDWPNPLKISAMPQMPKLMINTPITAAITVLPSQFDEALRIPRSMGPTCWQEGTGSRRDAFRSACEGVAELTAYHKVAEQASQPRRSGELKRLTACNGLNRVLAAAASFC